MSAVPTITGPERPALSGNAKQLIVILHGWGADGANLIDIADVLRPQLRDAHFIAPNAHEVCEVNPFGYQWFSLNDRTPAVMLEGVRRASAVLDGFVNAKLAQLGLNASQLAFISFSQGTMLALHNALRRSAPVIGVAGFSGALIGAEMLKDEIKSRPPVCLIHGEADEVVPFGAMAHAQDALEENKVQVEAHARPYLPHSIDMEGIEIAQKFLTRYINKAMVGM